MLRALYAVGSQMIRVDGGDCARRGNKKSPRESGKVARSFYFQNVFCFFLRTRKSWKRIETSKKKKVGIALLVIERSAMRENQTTNKNQKLLLGK